MRGGLILQGAIFLYYAGRIRQVQGQLDEVTTGDINSQYFTQGDLVLMTSLMDRLNVMRLVDKRQRCVRASSRITCSH